MRGIRERGAGTIKQPFRFSMSNSLRRSFVLLAWTAAAMAALLAFLPAAGHDQLWFLLMGRRWLGGATLYGPEIFDSNPPFVIWMSAVPVWLSVTCHLPTTLLAKALVFLTSAGVAAFLCRVLPRVWRPTEPGERPALLFAWITLAFVLPARDLGQRDALAGLLALPYVLAAVPRGRNHLAAGERVAAAIFAALAFCLKPQDALIAVAIEFGSLLYGVRKFGSFRASLRRSITRVEVPILLVCGLLYLLTIHRFTPLYFSAALPILRNTYWAVGHLSVPALLWEAIELCGLMVVLTFLLLRHPPVSGAVWTLCLGGSGASLAYLAQGTGWYYQQLPALTLFGAALALHLLDLHRRRLLQPRRWTVPCVGAVCLLAVALTTHFMGYPFTTDRAFDLSSPDPAFFAPPPAGASVAILTTSVDEAMMPVERYHLTWAQRTNNLWLLPAILRSESPDSREKAPQRLTPLTLARLRTTQHQWMLEDLQRWKPQLVLVERCQDPQIACQLLEDRHDDLLAWFQRDAAFSELWRGYRYAGTRGRFDAYTLLKQSGSSARP